MIRLTVGDGWPDGLAVVDILTLAVFKFADLAACIKLFHLVRCGHIAVVFTVSIDQTALLHGLNQLHRLLHILNGKHLGENVQALL